MSSMEVRILIGAIVLLLGVATKLVLVGRRAGQVEQKQKGHDKDISTNASDIEKLDEKTDANIDKLDVKIDDLTKSAHALHNTVTGMCVDVKWIRRAINGEKPKG